MKMYKVKYKCLKCNETFEKMQHQIGWNSFRTCYFCGIGISKSIDYETINYKKQSKWIRLFTLSALVVIMLFISLIIVASIAKEAQCADLELDTRYNLYSNKNIENGYGLSLKLKNEKGYYLYGGIDKTSVKYGAQQLANVDPVSVGFGISRELRKGIKLFAQVGYYHPLISGTEKFSSFEAMEYLANHKLGIDRSHFKGDYNPYKWKNRSFDATGALGGEIGINMDHHFTKNFSLDLSVSYRFLELWHCVKFWDDEIMRDQGVYWLFEENIDYSGVTFGINFTYTF